MILDNPLGCDISLPAERTRSTVPSLTQSQSPNYLKLAAKARFRSTTILSSPSLKMKLLEQQRERTFLQDDLAIFD